MHSPFPYSWAAASSSDYELLDDSSVDDTPFHEALSSSQTRASRIDNLSPVDEDVWSTFHFPSSPLPADRDTQHAAPQTDDASFPSVLTFAPSSSSSPHLTPAIRHLRLQSDLCIFPNLSAQPPSVASTPQRSSPGSPTVAAFLANPELLPKLLGRGKHQPQQVSLP